MPTPQRDGRTAQRELYGAPLAELATRVVTALGLTQGRLAEAMGLSAPMLSQLISGHRVKIGNPAVVHRLQVLLALADEASRLSPAQVEARLSAIRDEQATLTGTTTETSPRSQALTVLAALATPAQLEEASAATAAPELAALLREAARSRHG